MILLALAASWSAAEPALLYLRIRSTPVRPLADLKERNQIATVNAGQAFEVLERSKDGDWVKVRWREEAPAKLTVGPASGGKVEDPVGELLEGWVHATVLGAQPPVQEHASRPVWVQDGAAAFKGGAETTGGPKLGKAEAHAQARKLDAKLIRAVERHYPAAGEVEEFLRAGQLGLHRPDWPSLEEGVVP